MTRMNRRRTRRKPRSRISLLFAGIMAIIAALALIAITQSNGGMFGQPDATARQRTVDMIVQTRLSLTAEQRATQTAEATGEAADALAPTEAATPEATPAQ
jgi:hypothetical protein